MKVNKLTIYGLFVLFMLLLVQCQKEPDDRFERPPYLAGTNIETLEKEGNYNQFIALMDKAEYRTSIENQLFTLFVPNDSSFNEYLSKQGISSIDELSVNEAEELFGQHILINPRSRDQLMYEYAWGELQDPNQEYATLFHRKQSYSVPLDYNEVVRYEPTFKDQEIKIYRENTLIPLFTTEYFEDYFGDPAGSDYLFMYPESKWSGTQWHDAMVTEVGRTSTGFIYYIDRVVAPIPTIEKHLLENQDDFGLYYDIAQRFANYGTKRINEYNENTYRKNYSDHLSNIADERGPSTGNPTNMLYMFTALIPYDDVLQSYLDNTILKTYESIDSIPQLYLVYLLQSHLNNFLMLPSKMDKRFLNYYGDQIDIDINNDIGNSIMCSNGIIYAMNKLLEPNVFSCVPGPLFLDKDYSTFLYALEHSNLINTLAQSNVDVTLFAANNEEMLKYGLRTDGYGSDIEMQIRMANGDWESFDDLEDLEELMEDFVYIGRYEDFNSEGFIRMASDNYVYYNNNKLYSGGNQINGDYCDVINKIASDKNGNLFQLNNTFSAPNNMAERILADPELSSFVDLLNQVSLIDTVPDKIDQDVTRPRIKFQTSSNQWTILAPTNQALADASAAGLIPSDELELKNFINYHFIREQSVFDDGVFSGNAKTHLIDTVIGSDITYATVNFSNSVHNLTVSDLSGQQIPISHANANMLVQNGVLHKVDKVLLRN